MPARAIADPSLQPAFCSILRSHCRIAGKYDPPCNKAEIVGWDATGFDEVRLIIRAGRLIANNDCADRKRPRGVAWKSWLIHSLFFSGVYSRGILTTQKCGRADQRRGQTWSTAVVGHTACPAAAKPTRVCTNTSHLYSFFCSFYPPNRVSIG